VMPMIKMMIQLVEMMNTMKIILKKKMYIALIVC
jgi:hypothetical protein